MTIDKSDSATRPHENELDHDVTESTHFPAYPRSNNVGRFAALVHHLRSHYEIYTLMISMTTTTIAITGILLTIYHFEKQLVAQRRANAEESINRFFTQFADLTAISGADEVLPERLQHLIVNHAQTLIDGLDTGDYAGGIVRFLAANNFGQFIGRKPLDIGPRLDISHSALVEIQFTNTSLSGATFFCIDFTDSLFSDVYFADGVMDHVRFTNSAIYSVDFSDAWIGRVDFEGVQRMINVSFENATLFRSNLAGVQMTNNVSFKNATLYASNLTGVVPGISFAERVRFVERLGEAASLYRTQLDPDIDLALKEHLGEPRYTELTNKPLDRFEQIGLEPPMDRAAFEKEWNSSCAPVRSRAR